MLSIEEAVTVIQSNKPVEIPYVTQKGMRGLQRVFDAGNYWVKLSVSEGKPQPGYAT